MVPPGSGGPHRRCRSDVELPSTHHRMGTREEGKLVAKVADNLQSCRLGKSLRANLQSLWGNLSLADIYVTVKLKQGDGLVGSRSYALHKSVLHSSEFFRGKLEGEWVDSGVGVIEFDDPCVDLAAVETVFKALYGFDVRLCKDNVMRLIAAAQYLTVPDVEENCMKFLVSLLPGAGLRDLAGWLEVFWRRKWKSAAKDALVGRCTDLLSMGPGDLDPVDLLSLPPEYIAQMLLSNSIWFPDELARLELTVELLVESRRQDNRMGAKRVAALQQALEGVLHHGIYFMCIPEEKLMQLQELLERVWSKEEASECLQKHLWKLKEFHHAVGGLQPGAVARKDLRIDLSRKDFGWLRLGGEWNNVDQMTSRETRNLAKVYHGGSVWWLQLTFELPGKDKEKDVEGFFGVFLMHEVPRIGKVAGVLVDQRDEIKAEIKVACASPSGSMKRHAIWHVKKNRGWGWPQFLHHNKLQDYLLPKSSLRVTFALRLIS